MEESSIEFKFPDLINTEEYIRFECDKCKTINGTTIHKDGELFVMVCGNCWEKQVIR